jgi:hypothetical protein
MVLIPFYCRLLRLLQAQNHLISLRSKQQIKYKQYSLFLTFFQSEVIFDIGSRQEAGLEAGLPVYRVENTVGVTNPPGGCLFLTFLQSGVILGIG